MTDKTQDVFKVRDLFDSPLNIKTDKKSRWSKPSKIFEALAGYPKTSMLNRRRNADGSLMRSGIRIHNHLDDAVIAECDLREYLAKDPRARLAGIDSIDKLLAKAKADGKPLQPHTIAVDGDGVAKRVNGALIPATKALPFDEPHSKRGRKAVAAKASASIKAEVEDLRSVPVQGSERPTLFQRISQRIKEMFA